MHTDQGLLSLKAAITIVLILINYVTCAPTMYTYHDDNGSEDQTKSVHPLLETWKNAWKQAGWETQVLTLEDSSKNPLYAQYNERLEESKSNNIIDLPRESYMRNLAMGTTTRGGFYTDVFVYPLQKVRPGDLDETGQMKFPNDGQMTFHDGVAGSAISGNAEVWDKLNHHLLKSGMEKYMYNSLTKLPVDAIKYECNHLSINVFGKHDREICDKASEKFIVRLHQIDLRVMKVRPMKLPLREMMISKWFNFYNFVCWEKRIQASQLGVPFNG